MPVRRVQQEIFITSNGTEYKSLKDAIFSEKYFRLRELKEAIGAGPMPMAEAAWLIDNWRAIMDILLAKEEL